MLKTIGAAGVFVSCLTAGLIKSYKLKKRCESLLLLKQAVERVGVEISFTKKRLERIFAEISRDFSLPIFYDTAMAIGNMGLKEAWQENLMKYSQDMALGEPDIKALEAVGDIAGYAGEEQQRCIHTIVKLLELSHTGAVDVYSRAGKLYRSMGLLFGLLVVILLF